MHAPSPEPQTRPDAFVELHQVTHAYGRGDKQVKALDATDLRIEQGDFIALVGPSGCGKSTILKLVTGLIRASSGGVLVAGREVGAEPVRVGMAFQNPTLLPWLTLRDNVMLPLKIVAPFRQEYRAKRKGEFRDRIDALLARVGLAVGHADRGLGTLAILRQIEWARREGREHLYLGYWIAGHGKMDYKRRFSGLEGYDGNAWRTLHFDADGALLPADEPISLPVPGLRRLSKRSP